MRLRASIMTALVVLLIAGIVPTVLAISGTVDCGTAGSGYTHDTQSPGVFRSHSFAGSTTPPILGPAVVSWGTHHGWAAWSITGNGPGFGRCVQ